jgi:hypothetical protein
MPFFAPAPASGFLGAISNTPPRPAGEDAAAWRWIAACQPRVSVNGSCSRRQAARACLGKSSRARFDPEEGEPVLVKKRAHALDREPCTPRASLQDIAPRPQAIPSTHLRAHAARSYIQQRALDLALCDSNVDVAITER